MICLLILSMPFIFIDISYAINDDNSPYSLPLPPSLKHEPSYAIRIPFGGANRQAFSTYVPGEVSIPSGMTVVWFNDDLAFHTATAVSISSLSMNKSSAGNSSSLPSSHLPPMQFDTGVIVPGGFSVFTFTKPGIYDYYCKLHPFQHGRINVGDQIQSGTNFDMRIGGKIPFDSHELGRMTLSFVPQRISLPPLHSITYNVTIFNLTAPLYKHQFADTDGILDLEIVPIKRVVLSSIFTNHTIDGTTITSNMSSKFGNNANTTSSQRNLSTITNINMTTNRPSTNSLPYPSKQLSSATILTTTYGPDINAPITGTFHVEGPLLIEPYSYRIRVQIVAINDMIPINPIVDEFTLYEKLGFLLGL